MKEVLITPTVVMISQYINSSRLHIVKLKLTHVTCQLHLNKDVKKKEKELRIYHESKEKPR